MKRIYIFLCLLLICQIGTSEERRFFRDFGRIFWWNYPPEPINFQDKTLEISNAELAGRADIEDLLRHRAEYTGKVVKLDFFRADFVSRTTDSYYMVARDDNNQLQIRLLLPDDPDAIDWAIDIDKADASYSVYTYIGKSYYYAVGTRRRKRGDGYSYHW